MIMGDELVEGIVDLLNLATKDMIDAFPDKVLNRLSNRAVIESLSSSVFYWNRDSRIVEVWANDRQTVNMLPFQAASLLAGVVNLLGDRSTLEAVEDYLNSERGDEDETDRVD